MCRSSLVISLGVKMDAVTAGEGFFTLSKWTEGRKVKRL
jgi:hypothetical protein